MYYCLVMSSMKSPGGKFARIQIENEEDGGLMYEEPSESLSEIDVRWCLVGRFLT